MLRLILIFFLSFPACAEYGSVFVDEIVRVYDGDTITVNVRQWPDILGHEVGVRVSGVDTPEIRGECEYEKELARTARDFVRITLEEAEVIYLTNLERGKYFRVVADVIVDGENLASRVIRHGYGRAYEGGSRHGWCN